MTQELKASALFGTGDYPIGIVLDLATDGRISVDGGRYILADGSTYNVADYPELAQYSAVVPGTYIQHDTIDTWNGWIHPDQQNAFYGWGNDGANTYGDVRYDEDMVLVSEGQGTSYTDGTPRNVVPQGYVSANARYIFGWCIRYTDTETYVLFLGTSQAFVAVGGYNMTGVCMYDYRRFCFFKPDDNWIRNVNHTTATTSGPSSTPGTQAEYFDDVVDSVYAVCAISDTRLDNGSDATRIIALGSNGNIVKNTSQVWAPTTITNIGSKSQSWNIITDCAGTYVIYLGTAYYISTDHGETWSSQQTWTDLINAGATGPNSFCYYSDELSMFISIVGPTKVGTSADGINWNVTDFGALVNNPMFVHVIGSQIYILPASDSGNFAKVNGNPTTFTIPTIAQDRAGTYPYIRGK